MTSDIELPDDVVAEIKAGRKVAAIKHLRRDHGVDLKEAKARVDAYMLQNPPAGEIGGREAHEDFGRILLLIVGVGAIYGIYTLFS